VSFHQVDGDFWVYYRKQLSYRQNRDSVLYKPASKFTDPALGKGGLAAIEQLSQQLSPLLQNPDAGTASKIGSMPYYSSGGRTFIRVGGRAIGVAQSFTWKASYSGTPIHTIDSPEPYDIDIGRLNISGSLSQIFDPTKGPEADGLFAIMKAAVHQPIVEIQALDATGTTLFFARGMFVGVTGNVGRGQMNSLSAEFIGVGYQHYVSQAFDPSSGSVAGSADKIVKNLKNLASDISGGIL